MEDHREEQEGNGNGSGNGINERREIWGIVERPDRRGFWTKIGVAFENRDGSWALKFDYLPARSDVKLQLRRPRDPEEFGRPRVGAVGAAAADAA